MLYKCTCYVYAIQLQVELFVSFDEPIFFLIVFFILLFFDFKQINEALHRFDVNLFKLRSISYLSH